MKLIKNRLPVWICWILLAFIFILCFSVSVSPILGDMGLDSPIFMLLGKEILKGQKLYIDVFDHKGPIIFYLNALGMMFPGTSGVYALESLNLGVSLVLIYEINRLFLARWKRYPGILFFLVAYAFTMREGNSINEFSTTFVILSLYLAIRYFHSQKLQHPPLYAFGYGVCFAVVAFLRITNGIPIAGMVLGITIHLLLHKQYKNILNNIAGLLLGLTAVVFPICLYFFLQGSLMEMLDATFLFNVRYSIMTNSGKWNTGDILKAIIPCIASAISICVNPNFIKYQGFRISMCIACICAAVAINMGVGYLNYSMICIPYCSLAVSGFFLIKADKKKKNADYYAVPFLQLCGAVLFLFYPLFGDCYVRYYEPFVVTKEPLLIGKNLPIPKEERNEVLAIETRFFWYIKNDSTPPYKYLGNQKWWSVFDSKIDQEIDQLLQSKDRPKWILAHKDEKYLERLNLDGYTFINQYNEHILLHKTEEQNF